MIIVDAHQHFWKIDRGVNGWITDEISGIRRDYLPDHLKPYLDHFGISKTILVQASETDAENSFMLDQAVVSDFVGGIVAWVDLAAADAMQKIEALAVSEKIKGIRPVLQGIEDSEWVLQDNVLANLAHLPRLGLRFDALIQTQHLAVINVLAQKIPDLQIVVDHAAKPVIRGGQLPSAQWRRGIVDLAKHSQIYSKLSGLVTEHGPGWTRKTLQPVADHLFDSFGANRVMWGSDWPVLELDGSYPQWFSCVQKLVSSGSKSEQADILGGTASRFYGLDTA
ncbi:MAG: amidohydrolase family protein [Paracoccaceae bacterium]|jgi:L-fuconolactonase